MRIFKNYVLASIIIIGIVSTMAFGEEVQLSESDQIPHRVFFYNESTYLPGSSNLVHEGKLHYSLYQWNYISPYVGFSLGQDIRSNTKDVYNDNHVTPLIGVKYTPIQLPIGVYSEFRQNLRLLERPTFKSSSELDMRAGAYLYEWFDWIKGRGRNAIFQEDYGEILYSSMLDQNVLFQGWAKLGYRKELFSHLDLDLYGEFSAGFDRLNVDYCNYDLAGIGARLNIHFTHILTQVIMKKPLINLSMTPTSVFPWAAQLVFTGEI